MKSHLLTRWTLGLLLAGLPWVGGCSQDSTNSPAAGSPDKFATNALPAATNTAAVVAPIAVDPDTVKPVVPDKDARKPLPENIAVSPPLAEIVKMAQAGVDESIMLPFVKNATRPFELGSEQIIYLNDLGVPSAVITSMLQHDQSLGATGAPISAPTEVAISSPPPPPVYAPAYENPPAPASPEEAPVNGPAPEEQPVVNYNYFYDSLSPYGSWINVGGYGWCWQPTVNVIHSGWRPYCDGGRWLYSNCGWYWQSDYSWGGIAFHYGRWFCDPQWGWCWWPNTIWSPAWVTWRYTSDYCGWAPLPPYASCASGVGITYHGGAVNASFGFGLNAGCYAFVPWQSFYNPRPYRYCAPRATANQIYGQSVVVNNIVQGNNNTVINNGITVDTVTALSKSEIRKVAVRDGPTGAGWRPAADRPQRESGQMVVYRSALPSPSTDRPSPSAWTPASAGGASRPSTGQKTASAQNGVASRPKPASVNSSSSMFNGRPIQSAYPPSPVNRPQPDPTIATATTTSTEPQNYGGAPASASAPNAPTVVGATSAWQNNSRPRPGTGNNYPPTAKNPPGSIILVGNQNENAWVRQPLRTQAMATSPGNDSAADSATQSAPPNQPAAWQNNASRPTINRPSANRSAAVSQVPSQIVVPAYNRPVATVQTEQNTQPVSRRDSQPAQRVVAQPVNPAPVAVEPVIAAPPQASVSRPSLAPSATVIMSRPASSATTSSADKSDQRARSR